MPDEKINRAAFLYLEPKKLRAKHAQCATCMMWTGPKHNTCTIHGKDVKVTGDMSCGWYVEGKPMAEMAGEEHKSVTPDESDLYDGDVRCENCRYGNQSKGICDLYAMLNKKMPDDYDLDEKIDPKGCCNAFMNAEPSLDRLRDKAAKI